MKRFYLLIIMMVVLSCAVSGCAVFGRSKDYRPFDQKVLAQVVPGKTTANEITRWFGTPNQVVKLTNGNAYIYSRTLNKSTGLWFVVVTFIDMDSQHDRIIFFINNNDIVTHLGSSFNAAEASYGVPF